LFSVSVVVFSVLFAAVHHTCSPAAVSPKYGMCGGLG